MSGAPSPVTEAANAKALEIARHLFPTGRLRGNEFLVGSVHGEAGESLSVRVRGEKIGLWRDFGADLGGDIVALWAEARCGGDRRQAFKEVARFLGIEGERGAPRSDRSAPPADAPACLPAPRGVADPRFDALPDLTFIQAWRYDSTDGRPLMFHARYQGRDGSKEFRPFVWAGNGWKSRFPKPRPLFNLPALAAFPTAPVLIVEGEKTAEGAADLPEFDGWVITTWAGGAASFRETDWSPLKGRMISIWPDNDEAGRKAGAGLAELLVETGARSVRLIRPPAGLPERWDLADSLPAGLSGEDILAAITGARDLAAPSFSGEGCVELRPMAHELAPQTEWCWRDWLPAGQLALLSGAGGTGKSLIAFQLALHVAAGRTMFGAATTPGKVLAIFAEDGPDEIHRRLQSINARYGFDDDSFDRVRCMTRVGRDNFLMHLDHGAEFRLGEFGKVLLKHIENLQPSLVILDNAAQMFGGNENDRLHVVAFLNWLQGIAQAHDCAVLLLSHPSKSSDVSGSTGWSAHVRTVLTLAKPPEDDAGGHRDPDARVLTRLKANYAQSDVSINIRYESGALVQDEEPTGVFRAIAANKAEAGVVSDLIDLLSLGLYPTHRENSPNYLPRLAAKFLPRADRKPKDTARALASLIAQGRIEIIRYGPPSDGKTTLKMSDEQPGRPLSDP